MILKTIFNVNVNQLEGMYEARGKAGHMYLSPQLQSMFSQELSEMDVHQPV